MLRAIKISSKPAFIAEHEERMRKADLAAKELEAAFPHKFKHPTIGRAFFMDREESSMYLRNRFNDPMPGIEIYEAEPSGFKQVLWGLSITLGFLAFMGLCYLGTMNHG